MYLTPVQTIFTIGAVALGSIVTRFLPFLLFPEHKQVPAGITYLGKVLPPAMMGLLVVYCFKNVSFLTSPFGFPELAAVVGIVFLHRWKGNVLLSIGGGTALYMFLVQVVFAG